ncbi:hypothetical protein [Jeongeupia sp. USM3]|nr:hypothetical protein [Jeongeupia sp. USM3]
METMRTLDPATLRSAFETAGPGLVQQYDGHARLCALLQAAGETPEGNVG